MPARKWTQDRVLAAIRERQRRGLPLLGIYSQNMALVNAGIREFGSWRTALVAAGIPGVQPLQKWSRARVLEQILARQQQGLALTKTWQQDRALHAAATRCFGGWQAALAAANLQRTQRPRRLWTRERILEEIRNWERQGRPLQAIYKLNPTLNSAAQRHFGGWYKAIQAAGVDVETPRTWNRKRLIAAIQDRHAPGLSTTSTATDDHAFRAAVYKYFDSWTELRQAAGIPHPPRREWTRALILQEIAAWHNLDRPRDDSSEYRCSLRYHAIRHFGSWQAALGAAGVESQRRWSPARVLLAIRSWQQHSPGGYLSRDDRALAQAARKYFGSCHQAMLAAGITPAKPRKWTPRRIIEAIQDRHIRQLPPKVPGSALVQAARRYFGTWEAALAAAGVGKGGDR